MNSIKIHKVGTYVPTTGDNAGVERVFVCFAKQVKNPDFPLKSDTHYGTMALDLGVTLEEANKQLDADKDYSDIISFQADEDNAGFYRARLS